MSDAGGVERQMNELRARMGSMEATIGRLAQQTGMLKFDWIP